MPDKHDVHQTDVYSEHDYTGLLGNLPILSVQTHPGQEVKRAFLTIPYEVWTLSWGY